MSDPENKVVTPDAREASKSRVVTQDTILANLVPAQPALEAASEEEEKGTTEENKAVEKEKPKGKSTAQDRIIELANKRRDAEKKVEDTKRENEELRARIKALETVAPAVKQDDRPSRLTFTSEDAYVEALTDWKAKKAIIEREQQQQQARLNAEAVEVDKQYAKTVVEAKKRYNDFVDVVSAATTPMPHILVMAIKESEIGGDLTYYLSKHEDEARKIADLALTHPVKAIKYLDRLERDLLSSESDDIEEVVTKPTAKKRAPEPITPIRGVSTVPNSATQGFEEYKARRIVQQRR